MGNGVASRTIVGLFALWLALTPAWIDAQEQSASTATPTCAISGPTSGSYTVNVCITTPGSGTQLTGNQTVQGSITTVTGSNPGTQSVTFSLDGQYLITDFQSQYTFTLPTTKWTDGSHTLTLVANMRDGFKSKPPTVALTFSNGIT